jgi:exopolysaccharide biosynthesis protein
MGSKPVIGRIKKNISVFVFPILLILLTLIAIGVLWLTSWYQTQTVAIDSQLKSALSREVVLIDKLRWISNQFRELQNQDQRQINLRLEKDLQQIEETYTKAVTCYENLLDLQTLVKDTSKQEEQLATVLHFLAQRQYTSASAVLQELDNNISQARQQAMAAVSLPANIKIESTPPSSGYRRQQIQTDNGTFMADIIAADLNSTRVTVDTASDKDCFQDCPVLPLADYVARTGAYAGINGSYFCPATYPSCTDKKNSFDTLLMNKNKVYFNSDNNIYSTVPAVIFYGSTARFVGQSLEWGRDTSVDAVIANQPLLVANNQVVFGGDGDPKKGSKGNRSFIGSTGNIVYIGVVFNATVAESAIVLQKLGIANALNLDDGGSTALWSGGYQVGPGRNIPNAILLVRK